MEHLLHRLNKAPTTARKTGGAAELYYLRIEAGEKVYYKLGYTTIGVEARARQLVGSARLVTEVIDSIGFGREQDAYRAEQTLHMFLRQMYPRHRYSFKKLGKLLVSGDSEVYTANLLDMPELYDKVKRYNKGFWEMIRRREAVKMKFRKRARARFRYR